MPLTCGELCQYIAEKDLVELARNNFLSTQNSPYIPDMFLRDDGPLNGQYAYLKEHEFIANDRTWQDVLSNFKEIKDKQFPETYYLTSFVEEVK